MAALGCSWAALDGSWGALGPLLAALGAILGRHVKIDEKSMPKMTDFGSPKAPQMAPKSDQKATKNRCKKRSEKRTEIRSSWGRLGTILGRFGSPLGVMFVDFSCVLKVFVKIYFFYKNPFQEPSWDQLGTILIDFGSLLGTFLAPKTVQKRT